MQETPFPPDEAQRLVELKSLRILDTGPEPAYDDLARIAAQVADAPIALISLVDERRVWIKAGYGLDIAELPRGQGLAAFTIMAPEQALIVPDTHADPRFVASPVVTGEPFVRAYVGAPLVSSTGRALGALCVVDRRPRTFAPDSVDLLRRLARQIVALFENRRASLELAEAARAHEEISTELRRSQRRLGILHELAAEILPEHHLDDVIRVAVGVVARHLVGMRVAYSTIDARGLLSVLASIEPPGMPHLAGVEVDLSPVPHYLASLRAGDTVITPDVAESRMLAPIATAYLQCGAAACLDVPVRHGSGLTGLLCFDSPAPRAWSRHETELLSEVAGQLAHHIQRAQLAAEREAAEAQRRQQEDRWRLAAQGAGDSIWELDLASNAFVCTPQPCDLPGAGSERTGTLEGWRERIHPEDRAGAIAALDGHLGGKLRTYRAEYRVQCGDGWRWLLDRGQLLADELGRPMRVHGCHTDVTDRKRLESNLAIARDAALETARLKSQFLANMSHEIRTPMTGVIGMVELLLQSQLDDEQRGYAETVRACGQGLLTVLNDILDWSKIEAGKLDLEAIEFDPARMIEEIVELGATAAHGRGIRIGASFLPGFPARVVGDPHRLRQVISNLVGNAVKFTSAGGVLVRAEHSSASTGEVTLRVEVVDSGIGIDPTAQDRLFKSFSQADGTTTRRFGGTGLGLAISRQLVELMGGRIGVLSQPGQGSTFWFQVVLRLPSGVDDAAPREPALSGKRYLCITPHATESQSVGAQLAALGADCVREHDLASAARRIKAESGRPFDALLVDHELLTDGEARVPAILPAVAPAVLLAPLVGQLSPDELLRGGWYSQVALPARRSRFEAALIGQPVPLAGAAAPLPTRTSSASGAMGSHRRVLLAEDNLVNQKVATRMLERLGCAVDVAGDGQAALEAWRRGAHDVILMDLQMPVMDGIASTAAIRSLERGGAHVPILALTASAAPEDRLRCIEAGMDDCLLKPIQAATLDAALERWAPLAGASRGG